MRDAIAVEALKARRSPLPWLSAAAFAVATMVGWVWPPVRRSGFRPGQSAPPGRALAD